MSNAKSSVDAAALRKLELAVRDVRFRKKISGSTDPVAVAREENLPVDAIPKQFLESLATLSEDELTSLANINSKVGQTSLKTVSTTGAYFF